LEKKDKLIKIDIDDENSIDPQLKEFWEKKINDQKNQIEKIKK
jgi:hypothetical protein